jgi:hypothetical protein
MVASAALGVTTLALVSFVALPAASAEAATPAAALSCRASMSNSSPKDYSTVYVDVATKSGASVKTVAHYRTTSTTHTGAASGGMARIKYYISRATPGYKVVVNVTVKAGTTAACSTSFTPVK